MKFAVLITFLLPLVCVSQPLDTIKQLDGLMGKWIDLESQKGRLQSEWSVRKADLEHRLSLLNIEQTTLKEALAEGNKSTSEVDEQRLALLKTQDRLESEQSQMNAQLQKSIAQAQSLQSRLPPPIQAQWQERLPYLAQADLNTSEKLEKLLGLFKLVEEFDDRIALHKSTLEIPSGANETRAVFVTQIYLGASQGWYVNEDGSAYGYGRATPLGWKWWHGAEATTELGGNLDVSALLKTRAILENPTSASFVSLPIKTTKGM